MAEVHVLEAAPGTAPGSSDQARGLRWGRPWLPDLVGATVVLAILIYYWVRFGKLFPQVEFIDWITFPAGASVRGGLEAIFGFTNDNGFSRSLSIMYATVLGRACGANATCVNAFAYLPAFAGGFALYALARVSGLRAAASTAVVAVTLVSQPMFDVMSWQATLLDRLASVGLPTMMILIILTVRHARLHRLITPAWSIGLTVLALLVVNTKEPTWVLVPLAAAAPVLLARDRRQAVAAAATLALPFAAMTFNALKTLHDLDPVSREHLSSGSISDNLHTLTRFAVPGGLTLLILAAVVSVACLPVAVRGRRRTPEAFALARVAAWVGIAAVCGWIIPLRTQYPSAFYMLVPLGTAALTVALSLRAALLARPSVPRYVGVAVGVALVAWCAGGAVLNRWDPYSEWLKVDAGFRGSLPRIEAVHAAHPRSSILFWTTQPSGYRFVTANPALHFWRFAGKVTGADHFYPITVTGSDCGGGDIVVIRLDARMQMIGVCPR